LYEPLVPWYLEEKLFLVPVAFGFLLSKVFLAPMDLAPEALFAEVVLPPTP
jgi:hypothetical protein